MSLLLASRACLGQGAPAAGAVALVGLRFAGAASCVPLDARSCSSVLSTPAASTPAAASQGEPSEEGPTNLAPETTTSTLRQQSSTLGSSRSAGLWHQRHQHAAERLQWLVGCRGFAASALPAGTGRSYATSSSSSATATQQGDELTIHPSAVQRLKELQAQQPKGRTVALRIEVEGGGCSGYQYKFSLESMPTHGLPEPTAPDAPPDRVFEVDGVRVVCDPDSFEMLRGSRVEFEDTLMRRAFVVGANPNSEASCGCGSSFAAKMPPIAPRRATASAS